MKMEETQSKSPAMPDAPPQPSTTTASIRSAERMAEEGGATKDAVGEDVISGVKLIILMTALVLVSFLVMLDASIVATVCIPAAARWRIQRQILSESD